MSTEKTLQISDKQKSTVRAIIAYMHINILSEKLASLGMLGTSGLIPYHIDDAKEATFKVIRDAMNMNTNISRYAVFQSQIEKFSRDEKYFNASVLTDELFKKHYAYISSDYVEGNIIHIDAWLTDNDNEEGVTIAKLNQDTLSVSYLTPEATYDIDAQKYINQLKEEITIRWE